MFLIALIKASALSMDLMKKMMKNVEEVEARAEKARGGKVGSHKRGYSQICQIWDQSFKNKGIRAKGAGRKWYFTAHTEYLKRWHDLERRRSHDRQNRYQERVDGSFRDGYYCIEKTQRKI